MLKKFGLTALASLLLASCSSDYSKEDIESRDPQERKFRGLGKALGDDALVVGGPRKKDADETGIGVNSHLWRASLDTVSFMPISSADPFGGIILTDWYSPRETPDERFKMNVYIMDKQLRSDGVKVSVFRQTRQGGQWLDQHVDASVAYDMENTILMRARSYRSRAN